MIINRAVELPCGCMPVQGQLKIDSTGEVLQEFNIIDLDTNSTTMIDGSISNAPVTYYCACSVVYNSES